MKLAVAKTYVRNVASVSGAAHGGMSVAGVSGVAESTSRLGISLQVTAEGLGPHFRLRIAASSSASTVGPGATILVQSCAPEAYAIQPSCIALQCICPGTPIAVDVAVDSLGRAGLGGQGTIGSLGRAGSAHVESKPKPKHEE